MALATPPPLGQSPAGQSRPELSPAGGQQLGRELGRAKLLSDTISPCLLPRIRLLSSTSHLGLGGTLVCSYHVPPQHKTPPTPPKPHSTHTSTAHRCTHMSDGLQEDRPVNRWEQLQGREGGDRVGVGVWEYLGMDLPTTKATGQAG